MSSAVAVPNIPKKMGISRIILENFRTYAFLDEKFDKNIIVLVGENGSGKTNLLEAISFLAPGKGLRRAKLSEITTQGMPSSGFLGAPTWTMAAEIHTAQDGYPYDTIIGTGLEYTTTGSEKRIVKQDGVNVAYQTQLVQNLHVVWVIPEMDRLFSEGAQVRRRFLDRMACVLDADHARRVYRYEYTARQRLTLLKERRADPSWLKALEGKMSEDAVAIVSMRQQITQAIEHAQDLVGNSLFPQFKATMNGQLENWLAEFSALEVEEKFSQHLKDNRSLEAENSGTSFGPQRSDLSLWHVPKQQWADMCSTGEQKILLLAFVIAFSKVQKSQDTQHIPTLLLLDDVITHLDQRHREALFQEIKNLEGFQTWLTGTDLKDFRNFLGHGDFFEVENGSLKYIVEYSA